MKTKTETGEASSDDFYGFSYQCPTRSNRIDVYGFIPLFPPRPFSPFSFRLSADVTDMDELTWTLPTESLVLNREYRISYKVRVGKGVESGSIVSIPVSLDGPGFGLDGILEVLVK